MGETSRELKTDKGPLNVFMRHLINDIKALEKMLKDGVFESGVRRMGAEQELCLVDRTWRPAPLALQVLEKANNPQFTTEHSQYNLEINLKPLALTGDCFSEMETQLLSYLQELDDALKTWDATTVLAGILPTIRREDLRLNNLTPLPRYHLLNDVLNSLRGGPYEFRIEGKDELITKLDTIMFEGCNTSFQVHFQADPETIVNTYNWAQAISAPVLAAAVNSPMLLGKRLWQETRIALFQQSVDTRRSSFDFRDKSSRITFGDRWVNKDITELFLEDLVNYRVLMATEIKEESLTTLARGEIPKLKALQIHNGTVYRWNRACYGITHGKPHLRIENRILPAGPTIVDETANAAFWLGLMNGIPSKYGDIANTMDFSDVKLNFIRAARSGLEAQFRWGDEVRTSSDLILEELLPIAHSGLEKAGVSKKDANRCLKIIEERVKTRKTGASWMLKSFTELREDNAVYEASVAITAGMVKRQKKNRPVHRWNVGTIREAGKWINRHYKVEQIMTTDFFTVQEDDLIHFAANVMKWKHLRYVPVENEEGRLVGLITASAILGFYSSGLPDTDNRVEEIMIRDPHVVQPLTLSVDALSLMRQHKVGCLPVVDENQLVGVLTEVNFMNMSEQTLANLKEDTQRHVKKQQNLD